MKYNKQVSNGYISAIGTGHGGVDSTEDQYNESMATMQSCRNVDGTGYLVKTDLTWEE